MSQGLFKALGMKDRTDTHPHPRGAYTETHTNKIYSMSGGEKSAIEEREKKKGDEDPGYNSTVLNGVSREDVIEKVDSWTKTW